MHAEPGADEDGRQLRRHSKKALATAAAYAAERQQFGRPIASFGLIQAKLAEMAARAYAAESVAYRTAGLVYTALGALDRGARESLDAKLATLAEFAAECAMAKVFGSETYHGLADEALQIFGGNGFSEDYPVARMYRDSRITRIYEGRARSAGCPSRRRSSSVSTAETSSCHGRSCRPGSSRRPPIQRGPRRFAPLWPAFARSASTCSRRRSRGSAPPASSTTSGRPTWAGIATMAIELYAAESTALRVRKLEDGRPDADTSLAAALARLAFERAAVRVRQEAVVLLAGLHAGDDLREALAAVDRRLPLPADRIGLDGRVARALVERGGSLPDFAAA